MDFFNLDYVVWRTGKFNDDMLVEVVAKFNDLDLAKSFIEYQATLGDRFAIVKDGKRVNEQL